MKRNAGILVMMVMVGILLVWSGEALALSVRSPEFGEGEMIPVEFTCQGPDVNPPLKISDIPDGTESLAMVVEDPDAPTGTWIHWIVFDVPIMGEIPRDSRPGREGKNDFGRMDFGGPCPPSGEHRYIFRVYALDTILGLPEGIGKDQLMDALEGHVIEQAELTGIYRKQ
ncbi:MAG: YbhB/YbcL family Raf kinase inhibitor-like protein [Candidatus Omnitrophota bacterium]